MANSAGMFVELKVDRVMRAAFRAARHRDNMSLKALAEAAGVRESLLMRFEHGQYLVRVEELEGLNNAHKLLKLEPPEAGEPFEYKGAGVLPGTTMKRKKTKDRKPVKVEEKQVMTTPPQQLGRLITPTLIMSGGEAGKNEAGKKVKQMLMVLELGKQGILDTDAAKDAVYKLLQQLNLEDV